ncbi:hypothetical protein HK414_15780 [Ramlibacter terrae]|uniref:Calcium-binding protein n=1 Tax=Ramlibacter terrae TaxID=2732511 RepID=A0ABX6P3E8_9BURK|nr:hypothetical protein HK414_15780 [Ramlibacter terrae]
MPPATCCSKPAAPTSRSARWCRARTATSRWWPGRTCCWAPTCWPGGEGASIALFAGRDLTQDEGTVVSTAGGVIAPDVAGVATLESLMAGTGAVSITAGSVVDGDTDPDDAEVDIEAAALVLGGAGSMGAADNALETTVDELAVSGGGDLFLTETDALDVATLSVQAQRVGADAAAEDADALNAAGLATGATVVRTLDGTLTVLAGAEVTTTGNTLLQAAGEEADLVLLAAINGGADLSLVAAGDLSQDADVASTAGGSVVLAAGDDVTQAQGTTASTLDGILAVQAGGTFTLSSLRRAQAPCASTAVRSSTPMRPATPTSTSRPEPSSSWSAVPSAPPAMRWRRRSTRSP